MKTTIQPIGIKKALILKKKLVSNLYQPTNHYKSTIFTLTYTDTGVLLH